MIKCVGVKYLNECDNAIMLENGFGCNYGMNCEYQRPKGVSISNGLRCVNCGGDLSTAGMGACPHCGSNVC